MKSALISDSSFIIHNSAFRRGATRPCANLHAVRWWPLLIAGAYFLFAELAFSESEGPGRSLPVSDSPTQVFQVNPIATTSALDIYLMPAPTIAAQRPKLELTVKDAILMTLEGNPSFRLERVNAAISETLEAQERSEFDPQLRAGYLASRKRDRGGSTSEEGIDGTRTSETSADVEISEFLPTGTEVSAGASFDRSWSDLYGDQHTTRVGLTVTQALLKGAGLAPNLANLRQARLDALASLYELRAFAEALVAQVEGTYWDFALAQREIEIFTDSLQLAQQQLKETEERIALGLLAETELAAAKAEVALRREDLINARSTLEVTRLRLLRLTSPPGPSPWNREVHIKNIPAVPEVQLDGVEAHIEVALKMRPDLNQAQLQLERGDLEIAKTRNGLLPRLDLFIGLGKTGYANSFKDSVEDLDGKRYDILAGVNLEYSLGNRENRAIHRRAILSRRLANEAIENLTQLIQLDVRSAYIEANRYKEQVAATFATRQLKQEAHRAEVEKFRVGKSTSFLVAQAQRDLVASQISEISSVVNYLKALVDLYLLEGSLLERRGILVPGKEAVDLG